MNTTAKDKLFSVAASSNLVRTETLLRSTTNADHQELLCKATKNGDVKLIELLLDCAEVNIDHCDKNLYHANTIDLLNRMKNPDFEITYRGTHQEYLNGMKQISSTIIKFPARG